MISAQPGCFTGILAKKLIPFVLILAGLAVSPGCGNKKDSQGQLKLELVPGSSVLINAAKYSTCTDWYNYLSDPTNGRSQSIQGQWISIFNYLKITYAPTDRFLDWWYIRFYFDDPQVQGSPFTCNLSDELDALVSSVTGASWDKTTNIYQTGDKCKVICKGLQVVSGSKNQQIVITGQLKVSAYAFKGADDAEPVLVTGSLPVRIQYYGEP